ncbi:hypothetical protein Tco_1337361, partial [Tanacetum coccineum]
WVKLHGVHVTAFSDDGLSVIATKLGTLLMLDSYTSDMCMRSWGRSSYARALIERRADVELKDTIVDECLKNIASDVVKNLKNHSQSPRGVPVGPKVGFKPAKQVYSVVSKNDNANTIGNKKKDVEVRKEVTGEVDNSERANSFRVGENNVNIDRSAGGMAYALQIPSDLCDEPHDLQRLLAC